MSSQCYRCEYDGSARSELCECECGRIVCDECSYACEHMFIVLCRECLIECNICANLMSPYE